MRILAVLFCGVLAACSQTAAPATNTATAPAAARTGTQTADPTACEQAVAKAQQQATKAAMFGSALSMAGGLGGFAGRGGAIAAQAVSAGGSIMQAKAQNDTRGAVEKECLS